MEKIQSLTPPSDDLVTAAYKHLLQQGRRDDRSLSRTVNAPLEHIEEAYRLLEDLRVIEPLGDQEAAWHALEPQIAMARLVLPMEAEVARRTAQTERLRSLFQTLVPVHQAIIGERSQQTFEIVSDDTTLEALLDVEISKCNQEVFLLQPDGEDFCLRVDRCLDALGRGVAIRGVFPHGARYHRPTEELVGLLTKFGAQFRTADELPAYLIVFDARCCLLRVPPAHKDLPACSDAVAVVVRHPLVISQFAGIFATSWDRAALFSAEDSRPELIVDQLKHSILCLLASGAKDEMIARRLGLSVRTCRRHISDLMRSLGVSSRFQAGVRAGTLGLVPVPAGEPECEGRATVSSPAE